jgi:hypothetical protein
MEAVKKHHCMAVFKSDHFGAADLEEHLEQGGSSIFKILKVQQEYNIKVAGKKGNHNVAYFEGNMKPWVLNSTNTKQLRKFQGGTPMVEDWQPMVVELFVAEGVKAIEGGTTQGVRIRPIQPDLVKAKKQFTEANFEAAKNAGATVLKIREIYELSKEMELKYTEYVNKKEDATAQ